MIELPIALFYGFIAMVFLMVGLALKASPRTGMAMFMMAGTFIFVQVAIVDSFIMDYKCTYQTSYNNVTDIITETPSICTPITEPFHELEKLIYGIFGTTLIAIGAIILARDR